MAKMLPALIVGFIVFAGAAGGSWYVQNNVLKQPAATAAGGHGEEAAGDESHGADAHAPAAAHAAPAEPGHGAAAAPESGADAAKPHAREPDAPDPASHRMPVVVRPREMSVEELLRYGMGLKEREKQIKQQEDSLQQRRVQQQLALTDIEGERREIEGMRTQVKDQLKSAEKLVEKLNELRNQLKAEQVAASQSLQQIKHERISIDGEHLDNTKRLSQWMQNMDPEKAADVIKSMANDGEDQMAIAVQILSNFEEREAAKILSAMDDPKLVQQLVEKFRHLKRPTKEAAKR
jgi:flagellar motility protein MotE (MotC chaperone)